MGRRKVKIQRLESAKARQAKYSKRKGGFIKKANELAILCDVDVALLAFSPTDKPTLFVGQDKDLSDIVERLSNLPLEERQERKAYTMKLVKKIYPDSDSAEVDTKKLSEDRSNALKLHKEQLAELKEKIAEKTKILRDWQNPQDIEDLSQIRLMEEHLIASLNIIRNNRRQFEEGQQMRQGGLEVFDCAVQGTERQGNY